MLKSALTPDAVLLITQPLTMPAFERRVLRVLVNLEAFPGPYHLPISIMASAMRVKPSVLSRALRKLVARRMLIKEGHSVYSFKQDTSVWDLSDDDEEEVDEDDRVIKALNAAIRAKKEMSARRTFERAAPIEMSEARSFEISVTNTNSATISESDSSPIEERARGIELIELNSKKHHPNSPSIGKLPGAAAADSIQTTQKPQAITPPEATPTAQANTSLKAARIVQEWPARPARVGGPMCPPGPLEDDLEPFEGGAATPQEIAAASLVESPCFPGIVEPDMDILERICARVEAWYPGLEFPRQIRERRRQFPTAWFGHAVKRCKVRGQRLTSWGYIQAILNAWSIAGDKDDGPEMDYDHDLRLLPPDQRRPPKAKSYKTSDHMNRPCFKKVAFGPDKRFDNYYPKPQTQEEIRAELKANGEWENCQAWIKGTLKSPNRKKGDTDGSEQRSQDATA